MELRSDQEEELRQILRRNARGISTDALYNECKTFEDKQELMLGLHAAKNQGWCYKQGTLNFLVGVTVPEEPAPAPAPSPEVGIRKAARVLRPAIKHLSSEDVKAAAAELAHEAVEAKSVVEAAPVVEPVVVPVEVEVVDPWAASRAKFSDLDEASRYKSDDSTKEEPPKVDKESKAPGSRGFGNLRHRRSANGLAALALYRWRQEPALSLQQLVEITGFRSTNLTGALLKLVAEGFVHKDDRVFRKPMFKWTELYRYPFENMLETDGALLKFKNPAEYRESKLPNYARSKPAEVAAKEDVSDVRVEQVSASADTSVGPIGIPGELGPSGCPKGVAAPDKPELFVMSNLDMVIRQIDFELATHRHQITVLESMRSFLVPQQQAK